jgi:exonuclease SbcD
LLRKQPEGCDHKGSLYKERNVAFRFVHTADIHLDSPLQSLALRHNELSDLIGTATREVFRNIVQLCIDEKVDCLLISGDLYDNTQSSMKTALFLTAEFKRLEKEDIRVFLIRGNHDAGSRITGELVLPANVKTFGGRGDMVEVPRRPEERQVFIHGVSFSGTSTDQSLLPKFKDAIPGAINIGLLHTSLNGAPGHDPYAPCSVYDLRQKGFDYWGLGHIHKRAVYDGQGIVVMPGIPQGRDIGEAGRKSVTLVSISEDKEVAIEERITSFAQFERVTIDISGAADWKDLVAYLERRLGAFRAQTSTPHLVARIELTGATALYWQVRRDQDLLLTQLVSIAQSIESCWIDKLEVNCGPAATEQASDGADPLSELRRIITEKVLPQGSFRLEAEALATDFRSQLPNDCRSFLPADQIALDRMLEDLTKEAVEDVLAQLLSSTEPEGI